MRFQRIFLLFFCAVLFPAATLAALQGQLRIGYLDGDVQVRDPESGEWSLASVNTPLEEGDEVWVPDEGRAEISVGGASFVRLDYNTALSVLVVDTDSVQLYLSQGRAYAHFDPDGLKVFQFDTPEVSTRAFQRVSYDVYTADDLTDVSAYKGSLQVENGAGSTRLNAGNMVSMGKDSEADNAPIGKADEWERWNRERDERLARRGESSGYLPPELVFHSHDFDSYGRWVRVSGYGYVWTPTLVAGVEWSPYQNGRWIWRGGDYVWVSYDPWGWVPFHYGRWFFDSRVGWCWVPPPRGAVFWSPGYVGWVRTPDYVAWVPLAPGEIYYGYGDYGPDSVNVIRVTNVRVTNVYVNIRVRNAVTAIRHDSFAGGWDRPVKIRHETIERDIADPKHYLGGRPHIKPGKGSYRPVIRDVPEAMKPPSKVIRFTAGEIRKSRPIVKKPEESSITRDAKPRELKVRVLKEPKVRAKPRPVPPPEREPKVPPVRNHEPEQKRGEPNGIRPQKPAGERQDLRPGEVIKGGQGGRPEGKADGRAEENKPARPALKDEGRSTEKPERVPGGGEVRQSGKGGQAESPSGQRKPSEKPVSPATSKGSTERESKEQKGDKSRKDAGVGRPVPAGTVEKGKPAQEAVKQQPVSRPGVPPAQMVPGQQMRTMQGQERGGEEGASRPQGTQGLKGQGQKAQGQGQQVPLGPDGQPLYPLGPDGQPIYPTGENPEHRNDERKRPER